jgi:hypothetical protein
MQPTPHDPESINTVRTRIIMWCFITVLLIAAPWLALRGRYGSTIFVSIPLSVGMLSALIASLKKKRNVGSLIAFSLIPALVTLIIFFLVAGEGFICLLMATPLLIIPLFIGAAIGYAIQNHYWSKYVGMVLIFFLNTAAYVKDAADPEFDVITIRDEIVIDAPPAKVWEQLSHRFEFGSAGNFFLSNGVSFPTSMELQSANGCNSLYCVYNNGVMTASVDSLVPERLLYFTFHEPPVSMKETSLYHDVEPHHIRGRILIDYGSFSLVPRSDGKTVLIATTQLRNNIGPHFYWRWWSSYLMNQTHRHVLEKIKARAEE